MKPPATYRQAGVDIDAAEALVQYIRPLAKTTFRKEVLTDIGGFGGLVAIDSERFPDPVLVASTDGVGTKLRIAFDLDRHETIGIDLVAMCVNDVLVQGAEPLFFLDYFATGRLDPEKAKRVLMGIVDGCRIANCSLVGGETAEMPSFYPEGEYELAGFCVGVVDRRRILDGSEVRPGDVVVGIASNGLHSNGFSLAREIFSEARGYRLDEPIEGLPVPLGEELLRPTRIYVRPILEMLEQIPVRALAHITGGGLVDNIPRILPWGCKVTLDLSRWTPSPIFRIIEEIGGIERKEMLRTFNYGIGMVAIVESNRADDVMGFLEARGERCFAIGEVLPRGDGEDALSWG